MNKTGSVILPTNDNHSLLMNIFPDNIISNEDFKKHPFSDYPEPLSDHYWYAVWINQDLVDYAWLAVPRTSDKIPKF